MSQLRNLLPYLLLCKTRIHNYSIQRDNPKEFFDFNGEATLDGIIMFICYVISCTLGLISFIVMTQNIGSGNPTQRSLTVLLCSILLFLVIERYRRGPSDKICRICEHVDLSLSKTEVRESVKALEQKKVEARENDLRQVFNFVSTIWRQSIGLQPDNTIAPGDNPDRVLPLADKLNPNARRVL